jgi:hypothetical protein
LSTDVEVQQSVLFFLFFRRISPYPPSTKTPLLHGSRTIVVKCVEATSERRGVVEITVFSDAFLVKHEDKTFELVTSAGVTLEGE